MTASRIRASRWLAGIPAAPAQLLAPVILLFMPVVVTNVNLRRFVSTPPVFWYDLISIHLAMIVFFFALPNTLPGVLKALQAALAR